MRGTPVFIGSGFVANYLDGGGSFWIPLQYLLGFRAHGIEAYWLEVLHGTGDDARDQRRIGEFFERAKRLGAGNRVVVLLLPDGSNSDEARLIAAGPLGASDIRSAMRAGVLLNLNNQIPRTHRSAFARTILYDIDPGMLQLWSRQTDMGIGEHDLYVTIGQSIGSSDCSVPDCGVTWHRVWPAVHLPSWPMQQAEGSRYTTVTHWWNGNRGYDLIDGELYEHNKRTTFLEYLDLPGRTGLELELAAFITPGEVEDRQALQQHGWRLVEPRHVASTPWQFRAYIQASRGEFSCAKPSVLKASPGWVSDRTICYLASGRPCIVQDAGARRHLPDTLGLQSFSTQREAAEALRAAERDHERARRDARMLAEELFSTRVVIPRLIELAGIERTPNAPVVRRAGSAVRGEEIAQPASTRADACRARRDPVEERGLADTRDGMMTLEPAQPEIGRADAIVEDPPDAGRDPA
jgi:hypothetical protein